jgi:uncharacterized membrane protein HdeD (DUF308 family)
MASTKPEKSWGFTYSQGTQEVVRRASTRRTLWGVALIASGMLGALLILAAVSLNLVIAWLIVVAGMVHLIIAHHAHRAASLMWRVMIGFAYVSFGVYLIASPLLHEVSLALVLASLFLFEGIFDVTMFFRLHAIKGSIWFLVDGIVTVILGLMFFTRWPSTAARTIGLLVSVSVVTSGITWVMLALAARNVLAAGVGNKNQDDPSAQEYWRVHS